MERYFTSDNTLCCHWCGTDLSMASQITYLNGNLPVCQLCLMKAQMIQEPVKRCWCRALHNPEEHMTMERVIGEVNHFTEV
jgi:hypothetical protein